MFAARTACPCQAPRSPVHKHQRVQYRADSYRGWRVPAGSRAACCRPRASPRTGGPSADTSRGKQPAATTLYGILGVHSNATLAEVKAAYRKEAARLHPDVNASPRAKEEFQLLVDAYEVLCDVLLRRTYDKMGPGALPQPRFQDLREYLGTGRGAPGGPSGGVGRAQGQRQGQGQGQGPAQGRAPEARRGRDVHTVLGLMLSEAAAGVDKTVTYTAQAVCEDCKGSGLDAGRLPTACRVCRGTGEVLRSEWSGAAASGSFGGARVVALAACPGCGGRGTPEDPLLRRCASCSGRGRRLVTRELPVRVPGGVEGGALLRLRGEGSAGRRGGEPGDLLVRLEVYPDVGWSGGLERRGDDLHSWLEVDVFSCLLGGTVAVDTVRGRRLLDVPPGSQPGDVLTLSGAGVARSSAGCVVRGHHHFTLVAVVPSGEQLGQRGVGLVRRLAALQGARGAAGETSGSEADSES